MTQCPRSLTNRAGTALVAIVVFAVVVVAPVAATGAGEVTDATETPVHTVTDALDRSVAVPAPPQRIVAAGRAVLMIADVLYAFDRAPRHIVGLGRISQGRGSFVAALDDTGSEPTILERSVGPEQIAALRPDLVVLKSSVRDPLGRRLEEIGVTVVYVDLETPQQYRRDITMLGEALGEEERAAELVAFYERRVSDVQSRTVPIPARERPGTLVLAARAGDDGVAFQVPPTDWIQTRMVELAGGNPVWIGANPGGGWATVGFEQIAAWDPEQIIVVAYDGSAPAIRNRLSSDPRWMALTATAAGNLHAMPMDFYSWDQPDTRWILGLQWMATRLHPDLFRDISVRDEVTEFYREVYHLSDRAITATIEPTLTGDVD